MTDTLRFELNDRVGVITLDRPQRMNALSAQLLDELEQVLNAATSDDGIGALVLTGGTEVFCVGADLGEADARLAETTPFSTARRTERARGLLDAIERHRCPVIAAIAGPALGGGAELALACDVRIAAEGATIGFPEVKLGLLPAAGGTQRLTRLVGLGRALELLLTGDPLEAADAAHLGLVSTVVPVDELLRSAGDLGAKLARRPPVALAVIKQVTRRGADASLDAGLALEAQGAATLMSTEDAREGIRAFVEKRRPEFRGR